MTDAPITGGCQCGAVRYRVTGRLGDCGICHCRMCQRATGNAFAPLVVATGVEWQGTPATWASSNIAERGFCARCGTPLFLRDFGSDETELMTGTLDDPEIAPPGHHVGIESRLSWAGVADGLPEYVTGGRGGGDPARIVSHQPPAAPAGKEGP